MDTLFDATQWQASRPMEAGDFLLSAPYVSHLSRLLCQQTKAIRSHPYDPHAWLRRSITLARLRYPELAVGDAHKADLLCEAHLSRLQANSGWMLGHKMGFWMYDGASGGADRAGVLVADLLELRECVSETISCSMRHSVDGENAEFVRRLYPWVDCRFRKRSEDHFKEIQQGFKDKGVGIHGDGPKCIIKRHAFGFEKSRDTSEVLGVFASCDMIPGEVVLRDETRVWGCNGPAANSNNLYGEKRWTDPLCMLNDVDLQWMPELMGQHACSVLRSCRLLQCCAEDGYDHPLDHPLVARLTPNYPRDRISHFSLTSDIVVPNQALRQFGIDIFANQNYDTWVLFTIEARTSNNSCGSPISDALSPLFCFFNHSCEPNLEWRFVDHRTVEIKATRHIKQGDQLFVLYDGFLQDQPLDQRRQTMWRWLDAPCQCTRCVAEDALRVEASSYAKRQALKVWDISDLPVFPEDSLNLKN